MLKQRHSRGLTFTNLWFDLDHIPYEVKDVTLIQTLCL